jgi:hypothetical protein
MPYRSNDALVRAGNHFQAAIQLIAAAAREEGFAEGYEAARQAFYSERQPDVIYLPDESHVTVDEYEAGLRKAVVLLESELSDERGS